MKKRSVVKILRSFYNDVSRTDGLSGDASPTIKASRVSDLVCVRRLRSLRICGSVGCVLELRLFVFLAEVVLRVHVAPVALPRPAPR